MHPCTLPGNSAKNIQQTDTLANDTLGTLIQTIEFKQKATGEDLETFEDGKIPWISLDSPQVYLAKLIKPNQMVLRYPDAKVVIDYPLNKPVTFEIHGSEKGFTRQELILKISALYHQIYDEEESSAATKTTPLENRKGLINRNQTDGKYGIWGHDLSDLDLSGIDVYKNDKGVITLTLGIES